MKFPQTQSPFPPLQLSPAYINSLLQLERALVDQTIAEYDQFAYIQNGAVDKTKWKHIMTRENLRIYRAIGDHSDDDHLILHEQLLDSSASTSLGRTMSTSRMDVKGGMRLMGVGTIAGSLSDFLYCDATHTENDMQIRTSYISDSCIDWHLLHTLRGATLDNPFRTSTIKYHVKGNPSAAGIGVRPRDFVLLDCTGDTTLPNGEHVGYSIYHSIEVPGCGPREGLVRGQVSCEYVLRSQGPNSVEIYMRLLGEMGGNINDSIATLTVSAAFASVWRMPWGGQNKKLAWMLKQQRRHRAQNPANPRTPDRCRVCKKSFSLLRSATGCHICMEHICSKCLVVRKISYVRASRKLVQVPTRVCKHCVKQASMIDAADIARSAFVPQDIASHFEGSHDGSSKDSLGSDQSPSSGLGDVTIESAETWEQAQYNPHGTVYSYSSEDADENQRASVSVDGYLMQLLARMEHSDSLPSKAAS
ncbi:hypothetical protein Poli38472_001956 [Pythium oligandrum]|uniref:FYVE-type domain-containing protein n=1 Tax=Pythium oligandrum TaxID=41045 RepID=A0A8K1CW59_PYTOL|nr:hypothetical protein Poli38472_001956 [Pythium oligandrum]|eukprot:TMW69800.1 hypothetical protein Poli38472_001956 [Pythium oligandrum]